VVDHERWRVSGPGLQASPLGPGSIVAGVRASWSPTSTGTCFTGEDPDPHKAVLVLRVLLR
jgi:hypothetical protein